MLNAFNYDTGSNVLFKALEHKDWVTALSEINSNAASVRQWHFRLDPKTNTLKWKATSIHAAIVHGAPPVIIEALLNSFPDAARLKDDQELLPLHLAFRQGSHDDVMALILKAYPQAASEVDKDGKEPIEFVQMKSEKRWMSHLPLVAPTPEQTKLIKAVEELNAKKEEMSGVKQELEDELNGDSKFDDRYNVTTQSVGDLKLSDKFLLKTTMVGANDFLN